MATLRILVGACVSMLLITAPATRAQDLPAIPLESYPEVSRGPIGRALEDARGHTRDAARVGKLGMVLHAWEQYETAAAVYARARTLDRRFEWFYLGSIVEARAGRQDAAVRLLTEAIALAPGNLPARLALADGHFETGDLDTALKEYAALTEGASAPHAHYGVGRCLAAKGDPSGALREFEAAISLVPEFGPAWYAEGMALRGLGRIDEAKKALERAQQYGSARPALDDSVLARVLALRDDPDTHVQRALALEKRGDYAAAIAEYEAAIALDPGSVPAHVNLIAAYGRQQLWERAESHYRALEHAGAVPPEAYYNAGVCFAAQHKSVEAADMFRRALAVNPHHAGALSALGQLSEAEGRVPEAEASYRKALAENPGDALIRFNVGRMLIAQREFSAAITELSPLASVDHPDRARFLFGLATAYVLAGDTGTGRKFAVQARDLARERRQNELADAVDRELAKIQ